MNACNHFQGIRIKGAIYIDSVTASIRLQWALNPFFYPAVGRHRIVLRMYAVDEIDLVISTHRGFNGFVVFDEFVLDGWICLARDQHGLFIDEANSLK